MAPAADLDEKLLALQVVVAEARIKHVDLELRADLMERTRHYASAQALRMRADRANNDVHRASVALATYISKRQRKAAK